MLEAFIIDEWEREREREWTPDGAPGLVFPPHPPEPPHGPSEEEEAEEAGVVIVIDMT